MLFAPIRNRRTPVRRAHAALAVLLSAAVLVAGCGGDDDSPTTEGASNAPLSACEPGSIDGVAVSGAKGEKPTVTIDTPMSVDETHCAQLDEGSGTVAEEGDTVVFHFVLLNARTGKEYGSSYELSEPPFVVVQAPVIRGIRQGLIGARPGARVVVAISPEDGYGLQGGDPEKGLRKDDSLVMVADVVDVRRPLTRAEGDAVAPVAGLPTVAIGPNGKPTITVPKADPPAELVVQPLLKGKGAVVESGQTITVQYVGVLWATGQQFDSSWERRPTEFRIGTGAVIAGWDKGLVGQTIGSQVLLVVPPADGYGSQGAPDAGISATDTLVFVVDILDAR
jgi:peptidylprolyl isomerase